MKNSIEKSIDSVVAQIELLRITNANVMKLKDDVVEEWNTFKACKEPKGKHLELKRMLHATRAFDTGLRMFLEQHGGFQGRMPSIGGYVKDLQRGRAGLKPLNGNVADRISNDVTNIRNRYMHTANSYPSKSETDNVVQCILQYCNLIIGLINP